MHSESYKAQLLRRLREPIIAIAYIRAAAEQDADTLQLAILDVIEAQRQAGAEDMRTRAQALCQEALQPAREHHDDPNDVVRIGTINATAYHLAERIGQLAIMPFEVDPA